MTQKELLYVEDAVGHETNIIKILQETIKNLQDEIFFRKQTRNTYIHERKTNK